MATFYKSDSIPEAVEDDITVARPLNTIVIVGDATSGILYRSNNAAAAGYDSGWTLADSDYQNFGTDADFRLGFDPAQTRLELEGLNVTAGGATADTNDIYIDTGDRTVTDAVAGSPRSGNITVVTGLVNVTTAAGTTGASGDLSLTTGTSDVNFVGGIGGDSGAVTLASGDTDVTVVGVATAGDSGAVTLKSGDTDYTGAAAGFGGASGPVTLQSGDAASTGAGATSGATGLVTVTSGDSADDASGNVAILPGTSSTEANRGHVQVTGLRPLSAQATAITTTRTMSLADSGGVFSVAQSSAYTITLPAVAAGNAGVRYTFFMIAPGAFTVNINAGGATLEGSIVLDASVVVATGTQISFMTGAALIGDNIEVFSTGVNWMVRAVSSAAAGITITI